MTQSSWPYVDQPTTDIEYSRLFREFQRDGVVGSFGDNTLKASGDSTGLTSKVQPGSALIRGYMYRSTAVETVVHPAADATSRIDRVVLRLNISLASVAQRIQLAVLKGTAGSLSAPPLTQEEAGIWEMPLSRVVVPANATTLAAAQTTDDREWEGLKPGQWTTAKRPAAPRKYEMGFNDSTGMLEFWTGTAWKNVSVSSIDWSNINNIPSTFAPTAHKHDAADITNQGALDVGKISGKRITVSSSAPANPASGDIWVDIS
jgi:hypothetical protein